MVYVASSTGREAQSPAEQSVVRCREIKYLAPLICKLSSACMLCKFNPHDRANQRKQMQQSLPQSEAWPDSQIKYQANRDALSLLNNYCETILKMVVAYLGTTVCSKLYWIWIVIYHDKLINYCENILKIEGSRSGDVGVLQVVLNLDQAWSNRI